MAQWSVALFGHEKPRVEGWERRAQPGDIIAARPIHEHGLWTPEEQKRFLIVVLDGLDLSQIRGITEPLWDKLSIPTVPDHVISQLVTHGKSLELKPTRHLKKRRYHITLKDLSSLGVDLDLMLDTELIYQPNIGKLSIGQCFDKMNGRYALDSDGFNPIQPVVMGKGF